MQQYQNLIREIVAKGQKRQTRSGETLSIFGYQTRYNLREGFPAVTTKELISQKLKGNKNLGGRIGKIYSEYIFYRDGIKIAVVNGQKEAKAFCVEQNISFQTLCKRDNVWKNWSCERARK